MSEKRTHTDYLQKAAMYELLAQFYKYSSPNLHMQYYLKHLKYMNKALNFMRTNPQPKHLDTKGPFSSQLPDSPNIDVYIDGKRTIKDLPFKNVSAVLPLISWKTSY